MTQITKEAIEAAADAYWGRDVQHGATALDQMRLALEAALPFLPIAVEGKVKALAEAETESREFVAVSHAAVWSVKLPRDQWDEFWTWLTDPTRKLGEKHEK